MQIANVKHSHCEAKLGLRVWETKFGCVHRDARRIWGVFAWVFLRIAGGVFAWVFLRIDRGVFAWVFLRIDRVFLRISADFFKYATKTEP